MQLHLAHHPHARLHLERDAVQTVAVAVEEGLLVPVLEPHDGKAQALHQLTTRGGLHLRDVDGPLHQLRRHADQLRLLLDDDRAAHAVDDAIVLAAVLIGNLLVASLLRLERRDRQHLRVRVEGKGER